MKQEDKLFESLYLFEESSKSDFDEFNKNVDIKNKFDWISLVSLIATIVFVCLAYISFVFTFLSMVTLLIFLFHRKKVVDTRKTEESQLLEKYFSNKASKEGMLCINPCYPLFMKYDNKKKELMIKYQEKKVFVDYSDIKSYSIEADKINVGNRIPENHKYFKHYILKIYYNNGMKSEIGFSNNNYYFKRSILRRHLQDCNTKTINKLASTFDKIIKNGRI